MSGSFEEGSEYKLVLAPSTLLRATQNMPTTEYPSLWMPSYRGGRELSLALRGNNDIIPRTADNNEKCAHRVGVSLHCLAADRAYLVNLSSPP